MAVPDNVLYRDGGGQNIAIHDEIRSGRRRVKGQFCLGWPEIDLYSRAQAPTIDSLNRDTHSSVPFKRVTSRRDDGGVCAARVLITLRVRMVVVHKDFIPPDLVR
eukprot:CAMPEP_0206295196 /NCGR_PEP_ID=MMETSP0106_2-20121207/5042_1 /ASSEMBLY_ACC=CAM_ASM_000206 /TAXON_ID=81532 /ORGANISM="Acanthoeca-like sp., Strain 10tr" /LENGTH=104 /DNA_ID=CAMNT_0053725843 /DNA_START=538 /DNA_END=852 /DNA_ORIENTATION=-